MKKSDTFVLESAPEFVLGIDVGGTRLKAGAVSRKGKLLAQLIVPTAASAGPKALLMSIVGLARSIEKKMGGPAIAVGLGLPGAIDPDRGVVLLPGRLKGLENFPIVPRLRSAFGVPVIADNDARLAMIAEKEFGQARGKGWALTITIGTGVGSGVLIDGRILRDPHLQFGTQASHMVLQAQGGRLCFTGARGTAEMLCSAVALAQQVRDGLARGIPSTLSARHAADPASIDFAAVLEAAATGDRLSVDELGVWTANLGWFLVSAVHAYAPEIVILTGGGAHGAKRFLRPLRAHVNRHLFRWPVGEPLPIVVSTMIDHAGVLGAAAQAWLFA
ncbi:MAG TPA: ROK family protein [Planctomycetota bacterium]|nr:ROK family protein [Planctomycetota bacterium]